MSSKLLLTSLLVLLICYIFALPSPLFDNTYSTVVVDREGELLGARIAADGQWRFPAGGALPDKYKTCLINFEDKNFRYHPGVDPLALARATRQNLKAKRVVSGGSTITMQCVRLMRQNKRTFFEKFIEIILATRLELAYSKNEILELYAAHVPMGGNVVGINAAAWRYFGHDAAALSWAEAATLAVLPNSPSLIHVGRNRRKLLDKRDRLLQNLFNKGILDASDYRLAIAEPLPDKPLDLPNIAPHLVTQIYLSKPGVYAHSTINKNLQLQADEVMKRWNALFSQNGISNLASLIVNIERNEVLTYSGNVDFYKTTSSNQVDIIRAARSTGSILKPFLYCAMLQEGLMMPGELLPDIPININGFSPKNFSLKYDGAVAADESLARSLNVPWVVSLRKYSVPKFYDLLKKAGITSLTKPAGHYGLSLILGGAEASLWEVANGYSQLAQTVNDFNREQAYYEKERFRIEQSETTGSKRKRDTGSQASFQAGAAWLTLQALTNVNRPEEIDWQFIPSVRKVAWKTGTSFGFRDGWAIGVTPRYLVAVWTGNANGEGRPGLTGARTSAHVMFDLFNLLPATSWFQAPYGALREAEICKESGLLKGMNCPDASVELRLVPPKSLQGRVCDFHKTVHLSDDGNYRVFEQCAGTRGIRAASYFVLPPSWEWYYKQLHPDYRSLPAFAPECMDKNQGEAMQFIYPLPGATIRLPKQLDGSAGKAVFEIAHRNPSIKIFWHLDNEYLGESSDIHQMEIHATPGQHLITAVDETGVSISCQFKVAGR